MKYAIIVTCKEVLAYDKTVLTAAGSLNVIVRESEGWVPCTSQSYRTGEPLPKDTLTFNSIHEAEAFAQRMDKDSAKGKCGWHPWYCQPSDWEIVEVKPVEKREVTLIGWEVR